MVDTTGWVKDCTRDTTLLDTIPRTGFYLAAKFMYAANSSMEQLPNFETLWAGLGRAWLQLSGGGAMTRTGL